MAERDEIVPGGLPGMLGAAGNGEDANKDNKDQNANKEKRKTAHDQSPSLLSNVATTNAPRNAANPEVKTSSRNGPADTNCPITSTASTSLPTSNNALASSNRCVLPNLRLAIQPSIAYRDDIVKPTENVAATDEAAIDELMRTLRFLMPGAAGFKIYAVAAALKEAWDSYKIIEDASDIIDFTEMNDESALIFSEKAAFEDGLGVILPRLADAGIRVAVVATTGRHHALIDKFNKGKSEDHKITVKESVKDIMASLDMQKYYYFKVNGDPVADYPNVTTLDITEIKQRIFAALGKVCGVPVDRAEDLEELRRRFVEVSA